VPGNFLRNLKQPIELGSEIPSYLVSQCGSQAVMKTQPYRISFCKFQLSVVLIIVALHHVLGMLQPIFDLYQKLVVIKQLLHCGQLGLASFIGEQCRWITTVYHLEGCCPESHLKGGVVAVLDPWQPAQPVTRLISFKTAKVDSQNHVGHLRLAISLQVEGCAHPLLDAK
jgi:hypothetical protein